MSPIDQCTSAQYFCYFIKISIPGAHRWLVQNETEFSTTWSEHSGQNERSSFTFDSLSEEGQILRDEPYSKSRLVSTLCYS